MSERDGARAPECAILRNRRAAPRAFFVRARGVLLFKSNGLRQNAGRSHFPTSTFKQAPT